VADNDLVEMRILAGFLRRLGEIRKGVSNLGLLATLIWLSIRVGRFLRLPSPLVWRVRPKTAQFPLNVRLQGTSDEYVLSQIFIGDEYAPLRDIPDPHLIMDLGANVGFSSAYFLSCFPLARVIAVEPDASNACACRANLRAFGDRAQVLQGAAWSQCTTLAFTAPPVRGHEWIYRVMTAPDRSAASVQAWDIPTLMAMANINWIDLLKIDIEGAELELFDSTNLPWLPKVRNLCIELHGDECEDALFRALSGYEYDIAYSGELTILRNLRCR
jgi:FkbM family methyltransferase